MLGRIPVSLVFLCFSLFACAQEKLSVHWEELTAPDFAKAIERSQGTCVLPFGILEKHGAHLPLGTDLLDVRYAVLHATEQEYAVVFPEYYFGQIFEARHEPGTVAYSSHLQLDLLQETTDEMGRNGCKKIVIINGHGGNEHLLPFFAQSQLEKPHDYIVYVFDERTPSTGGPVRKDSLDMHAGESETSKMMIARPDLVHLDRPVLNLVRISTTSTCPTAFIPVSGGTRAFRITIPVTDHWRPWNSANFRWTGG
jgi:creatinine amidohydrolase